MKHKDPPEKEKKDGICKEAKINPFTVVLKIFAFTYRTYFVHCKHYRYSTYSIMPELI